MHERYLGALASMEAGQRLGELTRQLRLLRAHHLIHKLAHEKRYHLTKFGRQAITTVLAGRLANVTDFTEKAA